MRILLVSDAPLTKELGASKVVLELAEELERMGWHCKLTSIPDLVGEGPAASDGRAIGRAIALRTFLHDHAADFDVVDYGYGYLPFPRGEFPAKTLFVARSVLLIHHSAATKIPTYRSWKARAHAVLFCARDRRLHREVVQRANVTLTEADLVNVANHDDEALLIRHGISKDKIVVLPYGLSREMQALFDGADGKSQGNPVVAFVGTFDGRKGAADFPIIVRRIVDQVPEVQFRLFGTYKSKQEVLAAFPSAVRGRIDVIPKYSPASLPELLASCSIGVFPSYVEAFGFGVLEMLAVGLPVVAYYVPGPPMMLSERYLVPVGNPIAMSNRVVEILRNDSELAASRVWAKERSREFLWPDIARRTGDIYRKRWEEKQGAAAK